VRRLRERVRDLTERAGASYEPLTTLSQSRLPRASIAPKIRVRDQGVAPMW